MNHVFEFKAGDKFFIDAIGVKIVFLDYEDGKGRIGFHLPKRLAVRRIEKSRQCIVCGKLFNRKRLGPLAQRCDAHRRCRMKNHCRRCFKEFWASTKASFCSRECFSPPLPRKTCPSCRKRYQTRWKNQKYCDGVCARASRRKKLTKARCIMCNKKFARKRRENDRMLCCSVQCVSAYLLRTTKQKCTTCHKTFKAIPIQRFCSRKCQRSEYIAAGAERRNRRRAKTPKELRDTEVFKAKCAALDLRRVLIELNKNKEKKANELERRNRLVLVSDAGSNERKNDTL